MAVQNLAGTDATVRVTYYPYNGGTSTTYLTSVGANSAVNIDQRYDPNLSAGSFGGSAIVESTTGEPISVLVNVRGNSGPSSDFFASYVGVPIQ